MKTALLSIVASLAISNTVLAFTPPRSVYPLKAEIVNEKLDSMEIPRIKLSGKHDIQLDYMESLSFSKAKDESFLLTQKFFPNNQFALTVYPNSSISGGITADTVERYVRKLNDEAFRNREFFEIVTLPAPDGAPTKIRFLGAKPITVEYRIKRKIQGNETIIFVQDSWVQLEDETYLLRVEAPEEQFDAFFKQTKSLANSMFLLN